MKPLEKILIYVPAAAGLVGAMVYTSILYFLNASPNPLRWWEQRAELMRTFYNEYVEEHVDTDGIEGLSFTEIDNIFKKGNIQPNISYPEFEDNPEFIPLLKKALGYAAKSKEDASKIDSQRISLTELDDLCKRAGVSFSLRGPNIKIPKLTTDGLKKAIESYESELNLQ